MTPGDRSRPVARSCLNGPAKRIYRSLYSNTVGGGGTGTRFLKSALLIATIIETNIMTFFS